MNNAVQRHVARLEWGKNVSCHFRQRQTTKLVLFPSAQVPQRKLSPTPSTPRPADRQVRASGQRMSQRVFCTLQRDCFKFTIFTTFDPGSALSNPTCSTTRPRIWLGLTYDATWSTSGIKECRCNKKEFSAVPDAGLYFFKCFNCFLHLSST